MQPWLNRSGTLAVLTIAVTLAGCANPDVFDNTERVFSKPFDWTGTKGGYTFSELKDANDNLRPVTANDLVGANGACPPAPVAAAPAPSPVAGQPGAISADSAAAPPLGGSIALGMTECEVVYRAGAPSSVQFGSNPNGDRTAVLTYDGGPRPGIYRFERGRLYSPSPWSLPATDAGELCREGAVPSFHRY